MDGFSNFWLWTLIALIGLTGCKKVNEGHVRITFQSTQKGSIETVTYNLIAQDTILLCSRQTDGSGSAILEFDLPRPVFAYIVASGQYIPVYVSPGDDLRIAIDTAKKVQNIIFTGDGAEINRYLRKSGEISQQYELMDSIYAIQLEPRPFLARRDALKKAYAQLLGNLKSDGEVDMEGIELMEMRNRMMIYLFQQNYLISRYGYDTTDPSIPEALKTIGDSLPLDSAALRTHMFEYGSILSSYLHSRIYYRLKQKYKTDKPDSLNRVMPLLAEKMISEGKYPPAVKNFLLTSHVNFWVMMYGPSVELEMVHQNLIKKIKDTDYLRTVNKNFDRWLKLAQGQPAPDFKGITDDGRKISLNDLRGKIVYMDVWATWCGPCREEFQYSRALINEFKDNKKVAFLFVSTDEDIAAWKKLLTDKSTPKGIQVNIALSKQSNTFRDNYFIYGIPRYLIVNADGKIVQALAARPSSGEVAKELHQLLKVNEDVHQ